MSRIKLEVGVEPLPGLRLRERRGVGGFGEVWEAVDRSGHRSAVKFMPSQNASSSCAEMKIVQAIQRVHHPHLLRIDQVCGIPGYIVVAMELADGSLSELLDAYLGEYHTPLTPELLITYMRQAASAIDFLNTRRHAYDGRTVAFVHCDIKPSNLLLRGESVKLADFGMAQAVCAASATISPRGTPDFIPPEAMRGQVTETSDQYSLAVTYYYLRTGELPFPKAKAEIRRELSFRRKGPDLSRLHRGERKVLEMALAPEPKERWSNCAEMVEALAETVQHPDAEPPSKFGGTKTVLIQGSTVV